jgi:hypothetical protein
MAIGKYKWSQLNPKSIVLSGFLGGLILVSCASQESGFAPSTSNTMAQSEQLADLEGGAAPEAAERSQLAKVDSPGQPGDTTSGETASSPTTGTDAARPVPQLIKTVTLELKVEDTSLSIEAAQQVVRQQQGDLLQLQDSVPVTSALPHQAYLELRVPQNRLDQTIEQLVALGKIQDQNITAEDVSSQLVDYDARLRNLEKSEEMVLGIMERSGEVGEVLQVAQELQRIREEIERINAQLQNLKTRVAFSTVHLYLSESAVNLPQPDRSWTEELQQAWRSSTRALGNSARGIAVLLIWIVTFSPYGLAIVGCVVVYRRLRRAK